MPVRACVESSLATFGEPFCEQGVEGRLVDAVALTCAGVRQDDGCKSPFFDPATDGGIVGVEPNGNFADS